jgi:outer membrane biosynthesis protein TonB
MAESELRKSFRSGGGTPFILFLLISLILNGLGAVSGWWLKLPEPPAPANDSIQLTELDTNDVEKLGDPNAPEEPPTPPEPEPTPPPPEPEPTPPPLDKPPEFEIPEPTPTPVPSPVSTPIEVPEPTPTPAPTPLSTPIPHPTPKPQPPAPRPAPQPKPAASPAAAAAPGLVKGSKTGAPNGTGNGGPRSGTLIRSPRPSYPPQALQMHITGEVRVAFVVQNGNIVDARAISGPPMLGSYVIRFCRENWKFSSNSNGTYTLPVSFQLAH